MTGLTSVARSLLAGDSALMFWMVCGMTLGKIPPAPLTQATMYTHLWMKPFNPALAPLAPQSWGELALDAYFLPPELGGRGG